VSHARHVGAGAQDRGRADERGRQHGRVTGVRHSARSHDGRVLDVGRVARRTVGVGVVVEAVAGVVEHGGSGQVGIGGVAVVALDDGGRMGAGGAGAAVGTGAVLGRRGVVVVQGVRDDPRLVVVPLGVADYQMTTAVRARVAEGAVLGVHAVEGGVAVGAGA